MEMKDMETKDMEMKDMEMAETMHRIKINTGTKIN